MKNINCNLCGQDNAQFLFKVKDRLHKIDGREFDLVKCRNCGLAYLNPQPEPDELSKYYPENYGPYEEAGMEMFKIGPIGRLFKKIKNYLSHGKAPEIKEPDTSVKNYLDFGCGGGFGMERTKASHPLWNIEGSDMSLHACEKARSKGFKVYNGLVSELKLQKEYYDIINMSHVIEHLNDPADAVKKLKEFLKPGGRMIISTPNFDSIAAKIFRSYWYAADAPRHLYLFNCRTLSELIKKSGLAVAEISYDTGPKVAIKSIYYIIGKKDMRINHFLWRMLSPFSKILGKWGGNSIMTITAVKK